MNHDSAVVPRSFTALFQFAIAGAVFGFYACHNTLTEGGHDDRPPPRFPTRETIPDDTPPKIRKLMEKLLSGDPMDRIEAIIIAKRLGPRAAPLIPYLIDNLGDPHNTSVGRMAGYAFDNDELCELAVEPLIAALSIKEYKGLQKRRIIGLLGEIGDRQAIPSLIATLEDVDPEVRESTVNALSAMPDQRAFEPLMRCLSDKNDRVVSAVIRAMGEIGDRRAVEPIIALLLKKPQSLQSSVRSNAAETLGKIGDRRAFDALLATYKDKNDPHYRYLRDEALTALGRTKDPRAFEVLCQALNKNQDIDDRERIAAVWGLGGLGDERSIALLKTILKDERPTANWWKTGRIPRVRPETARALVSTGDDGAIDAVWEEYKVSPEFKSGVFDSIIDWHFRTAAVDALAMSPKPRAYLKVIDILDGTDARMCYEAARVLYCSTISPDLSEIDISPYERRKLPALKDAKVLQTLMNVAESAPPSKQTDRKILKQYRDTREYALKALHKSGNPEAMQFVEKMEKEEE